jgi:hypothetical protein
MAKNHKKKNRKKSGGGQYRQKITGLAKGHRWISFFLVFFLLFYAQYAALSSWYTNKHSSEPLQMGTTFIPSYAKSFGLDPKETLDALINDMGFERFRFVSYWRTIEKKQGIYDFSQLDWQLKKAEEAGATVTLSIGLRQPRWPECQAPKWVDKMSKEQWYPKLKDYMRATIDHVKDKPYVESYQLENEYFLDVFGRCNDYGHDRERLVDEYNFVKSLDPSRPIILSLANNYFGLPLGQPRPDEFGISVYKRVWDQTITKRYFEYPFPARYYTWRSALTELFTGKPSLLHELQAEPWGPKGIRQMSIPEQDKSMSADALRERIGYAVDTGYRKIDFWGAEWWLWRKEKLRDPSLWNTVKEELQQYNQD